MLRPERLGYVFLNVHDLAVSEEFFTKAVHLDVSARIGGRVYLRGGLQHHWVVLEQSETPGLERLGIEIAGREALDAFEQRLRERGVEVESGNGLESDRVLRYVRFRDPSGNPLELYTDMVTMPYPPNTKLVSLLDIQHVVLTVHNFEVAHEFYTNVLGMRTSDFSEQSMAWMHFRNGWHHGIGIGEGAAGRTSGLSHMCFQPPDLENTMRGRAAVQKLGLPITNDILKHRGSGSIGFYFRGPDTVVEFSYDARRFSEDEEFTPRIMPKGQGGNVWAVGMDDLELLSPDDLHRRMEIATPAGG